MKLTRISCAPMAAAITRRRVARITRTSPNHDLGVPQVSILRWDETAGLAES
jgi:hypothetical protein